MVRGIASLPHCLRQVSSAAPWQTTGSQMALGHHPDPTSTWEMPGLLTFGQHLSCYPGIKREMNILNRLGRLGELWLFGQPPLARLHTAACIHSRRHEHGAWGGVKATGFGLAAAIIWASETVIGRYLLQYASPPVTSLELLTYRQYAAPAMPPTCHESV